MLSPVGRSRFAGEWTSEERRDRSTESEDILDDNSEHFSDSAGDTRREKKGDDHTESHPERCFITIQIGGHPHEEEYV
jgi:hypothetical protein